MNEELYNELKEIEERLYNIAENDGGVIESKLGDAWCIIYDYLYNSK